MTEEGRRNQALEDLIVQTEIFLQYSLQAKALERLQKIASMFPGEEERQSAAEESVPNGELVAGRSRKSKNGGARGGCRTPPRVGTRCGGGSIDERSLRKERNV